MEELTPETRPASSRLVAPLWHTVMVVLILLGFSVLGAHSRSAFGMKGHGHIAGYLMAAGFEWLTVAFVWLGVRLRGHRLSDLLGDRGLRWSRVTGDLGLAVLFLVISNVILGVLAHFLKATPNRALRGLFPQGAAEVATFVLLALTAGICEETIFRGYLQRQISLLSGSAAAGIIIQGIIFGASHGYQGPKYMIIISVYGCLFGVMAYWRRTLLPGMIAHFLQDGVLGLLLGHAMKQAALLRFALP